MTAHKHAEHMLQYAQDAAETDRPWELWQNSDDGVSGWNDLDTHPMWVPTLLYRRKPRTIRINGHEVSKPVRRPLEHRTIYFVPTIDGFYLAAEYDWQDDETDNRLLEHGLIHLTEEAAIAHAKALLSFTAKQEPDDE